MFVAFYTYIIVHFFRGVVFFSPWLLLFVYLIEVWFQQLHFTFPVIFYERVEGVADIVQIFIFFSIFLKPPYRLWSFAAFLLLLFVCLFPHTHTHSVMK